jgi:predicted acylesterase/phospholipase RssA
LRTAGGPGEPSRNPQPGVIAVVGLHRGAHAAMVAATLERRLAVHHRVVTLDQVDPEQLDRAERESDRVLLVAASSDGGQARQWRDFCLRQADAVVLVANADEEPPTEALAPSPNRQPDLVLLGAAPGPDRRAGWVDAVDAWQLTLVGDDVGSALRPLADRLAGRSLGIALAGGGARAFAHVGVLRELADAGLHVDRVAGSCIGAVIAGMHAAGYDDDALEEVAYREFVRHRPFSDWQLPIHSLARGRRMADGLARTFGDTVFEGLGRQLHTVSTDLVSRSRHVHRRGRLTEALAASARLPVLLAPIPDDDGRLLVDGGVLDNLPVDLLTDRDEGPVVAVNIAMGGGGGGRSRSARPRVPALGETLLRTMMIGSGGAVTAARAEGAWVVTPPTLGVGLLEFHQLDRMIEAGRMAARALLEEAGDDLFGRLTRAVPTQRAASEVGGSGGSAHVQDHALLSDEHV